MHAAFEPARVSMTATLSATLTAQLRPGDALHIERDTTRRGVWSVARACWEWGLRQDASHVVLLNDDALPCPLFVEAVHAALAVRSDDLVCFYANHETELDATEANESWWTSDDGFVTVACAIPRARLLEFLSWQDAAIVPEEQALPEDARIDLWAMAHHRRIWHARGLVEHGAPLASLVGNNGHEGRSAVVSPPAASEAVESIDWLSGADNPYHVGLIYSISPAHLLRTLRKDIQLELNIEATVDQLWGDESACYRAAFRDRCGAPGSTGSTP